MTKINTQASCFTCGYLPCRCEEFREAQKYFQSDSNALLYVIAGADHQARRLARDLNVPPSRLRYINRPDKLRGIDGNEQTSFRS